MDYFRSLIPSNKPAGLDTKDELKVWQERSLQILLVGFFATGLIVALFLMSSSRSTGNWSFFAGCVFLSICSTILFFFRRISYWIRSIAFLIVLYVFTTITFIRSGWGGVALLLLLCFSFLSTILLYRKSTRIGLGLSVATLIFWAILRNSDLVPGIVESASFVNILADVVLVALVGLIGNFAINALKIKFLEQHQKFTQSVTDKESLLETVENQKHDLDKRLFQLKTVSEISRSASSIFDPQILFQSISDLIKDRFNLYYVGIFIIDSTRDYAVLRYGTGEAGRRMIAARHRLAVGGYSMIGWATQTRKSRVALDVGDEAVHFDNPLLPETRSELAIPILSGNTIHGALTIQSAVSNAFDENDLLILQSIADILAVSLENTLSYQKSQKALEDVRVMNRAYVKQAWWDVLDLNQENKFEYANPQVSNPIQNPNIVQVPLRLRDEIIGYINLEFESSELPDDTKEFLEAISSQTTIALENAKLIEETQLTALQGQKLNDLTAQFSRALTIDEILKTAVTEFGQLPSVSEASISLLPPEDYINPGIKTFPGKEDK
jgi:GAF domain-containing protein